MSFTTFCMCTTKERKSFNNFIFVRSVLDGDRSGSETNILHTTKDCEVLNLHVCKVCIIVTNDDHGKLNCMIEMYMDILSYLQNCVHSIYSVKNNAK